MKELKKHEMETLAKIGIYPKESLLKVGKNKNSLFIGIPKEEAEHENRVALKPESVELLVNNGHEIWIESGAGQSSKYTDNEYSEAGAKIIYNAKEVYEANVILKIGRPTAKEIELMKPSTMLISAMQMSNLSSEYIIQLNRKKITAIAFELLEDKVGGLPFVRAMSEIAGSTVMLIAAEYLSSTFKGKGVILGGITGVPPTKVVILGAGTVAEYAARAALGLGAEIQIFDNHIYKLRRIKHALGQQVYTSTFDTFNLSMSIKSADVVIGAVRPEKGRNKCIVTEHMVSEMKPDSIIIDVSIDYGGCFETSQITTHKSPVYRKYGVIHYCVPNIASRVARTATNAISNIFTPILLQAGEVGGIEEMLFLYSWFQNGVYTYKGCLTNEAIAQKYKMNFKDLSLLMAARM